MRTCVLDLSYIRASLLHMTRLRSRGYIACVALLVLRLHAPCVAVAVRWPGGGVSVTLPL